MLFPLLAQAGEAADTTQQAAGTANTAGDNPLTIEGITQWLTPEKMMELALHYGVPLLIGLLILVGAYFLAGLANRGVRNALTRAKLDETLARFFGKMVKYTVLALGVVVALGQMGVEVTAFAAILASAGFAVGMALSGTLGHFASGIMLLIFRPFKVGDVINAAGVTGKVYEIELFTTAIDTFDNRRIIVPNGSIYGSTIENITHHHKRRVDVNVGVSYSADIDKTREVLNAAALSVEGILSDPAHAVVLGDLGASSVNWTVRVWCNTADFWAIKEKTTRAVKKHLDDAGIGIPFPQMDVHLFKTGE
jgi:small conductance mechanosensitive channel